MTDNLPEINQALFQKIHDQITFHPETHEQISWVVFDEDYPNGDSDNRPSDGTICGTTRCVAGWAVWFSGYGHVYKYNCDHPDAPESWSTLGAKLLGLTDDEAGYLFLDTTNEQAAKLVERYALKGRDV